MFLKIDQNLVKMTSGKNADINKNIYQDVSYILQYYHAKLHNCRLCLSRDLRGWGWGAAEPTPSPMATTFNSTPWQIGIILQISASMLLQNCSYKKSV